MKRDDLLAIIGGATLLFVAIIGAWLHSLPDPPSTMSDDEEDGSDLPGIYSSHSDGTPKTPDELEGEKAELVDDRPEDADPYCNRHVNRSLK